MLMPRRTGVFLVLCCLTAILADAIPAAGTTRQICYREEPDGSVTFFAGVNVILPIVCGAIVIDGSSYFPLTETLSELPSELTDCAPGLGTTFIFRWLVARVPALGGTHTVTTSTVCDVSAPGRIGSSSPEFEASFNFPPVCSVAKADPEWVWPPQGRMVPIEITGVFDPDDDPVVLTVESIVQDEKVLSHSSGRRAPDATLSPLAVRAERESGGNGRIYRIGFTARDDTGAVCEGAVEVCVPARRHEAACPGSLFDSTVP